MHRGSRMDPFLLVVAALLLLSALFLPLSAAFARFYTPEEWQLTMASQNGELIRLHVIANSNTPWDQAFKLVIRNEVISLFDDWLKVQKNMSCDERYAMLFHNRSFIEDAVGQKAEDMGYQGSIAVDVGVMELPPKTYGRITLPKGNYRALRVVIGEGKGENWWCVLFPQLCLALSDDGSATPDMVWESGRIFSHWLAFAD